MIGIDFGASKLRFGAPGNWNHIFSEIAFSFATGGAGRKIQFQKKRDFNFREQKWINFVQIVI